MSRTKEIDRNKPTKPGLYWVREVCDYQDDGIDYEYDKIVRIFGDPPYMKYEAWDIYYVNIIEGSDPDCYIFGPEIKQPKMVVKYINKTKGNKQNG